MDLQMIKVIGTAAVVMIGVIGPAIAVGMIGARGVTAIGRNPEASSKIQTAMILAIAFAEAIAIYALITGLILRFV